VWHAEPNEEYVPNTRKSSMVTDVSGGSDRRAVAKGTISSAAFASGDQFVIGYWPQSPLGPFHDIMWLDANDTRTLIASSRDAADFITSTYHFDHVMVASLHVESEGATTKAWTDELEIQMAGGRLRPLPLRRPLAVTRYIEAPIARWLMGVETYGLSPTGAREWYQTSGWRWARAATARHGNDDLGELVEFTRPMNVGFSNPPRRASIVSVTVTIERPTAGSGTGA